MDRRRVGVLGGVGMRVVFPVHRHPLANPDAGGQPQRDPEGQISGTTEADRSVGDAAVQVHRRADVGEGGHRESGDHANEKLDEDPV